MAIERLSADDQLMLHADAVWPQDVGALAILDGTTLLDPDGTVGVGRVRDAIADRLHLVPRFRQRIDFPARGRGGPLWVDCRRLDLADHVLVRPLPPGSDESALLLVVEQLRRRRLDASRPLWEMWLLPGLADRRIGVFMRIHHAIGDGRAAMSMLGAILDTAPDAARVPALPWTPARVPLQSDLVADNLLRFLRLLVGVGSVAVRIRATVGRVRAAWPATRELLAEEPGSVTSLDGLVGPSRNLALVRSSVTHIRTVARAHDATSNDVLLALTAGGLRALFRTRGDPVDEVTVRIYVPVSLRRRLHGAVQGNLISQMVVPLPVGVGPSERLRDIAAQTRMRKERSRDSVATLFRGRLLNRMLLRVMSRQKVNVTSASIPGPRRELYLAGAPVLEMFPFLNLIGWVTLGVGALTYAGRYEIGIVADGALYPDLEIFATGMRQELEALESATLSSERGDSAAMDAGREAVQPAFASVKG